MYAVFSESSACVAAATVGELIIPMMRNEVMDDALHCGRIDDLITVAITAHHLVLALGSIMVYHPAGGRSL